MRLPNMTLPDSGTRILIAVFVLAALLGIVIALAAIYFVES
jgi:hypothetical protein